MNNLDGEDKVKESFSFTEEVTKEETFTHTVGASLEIGATFDIGVPRVWSGKILTALTPPYKHSFGKTISRTQSSSAIFTCTATAHRYAVCEAFMNFVTVSVPYTMTIKHNDYGCTCKSQGIYKSVYREGFYMEVTSYTSIPSADEAKYVKSVENQSR